LKSKRTQKSSQGKKEKKGTNLEGKRGKKRTFVGRWYPSGIASPISRNSSKEREEERGERKTIRREKGNEREGPYHLPLSHRL